MNIIITGASAGIGFACVKHFAANGEHKILCLSRNIRPLDELAAQSPGKIIPLSVDLAEYRFDSLEPIMREEGMEHVDVLIHNAGMLINEPFEKTSAEVWEQVYRVNVIGVAMLTRYLMAKMGGEIPTHVVMIGSMGGVTGSVKFPGLSSYSSSKGALAILAELLAEELREKNIMVNYLALGSVQTEMFEKAFPGMAAKLTPESAAEFICDFSLHGWRYFNGKIIPVSKGNP